MSKQSEGVKKWRKECKARIVVAMGGSCCVCGYNRSNEALILHHLDPSQKDFAIGGIRANPKSWDIIVKELRKCVLLCSNCHAEIHAGIVMIPDDAPMFDETFADYKALARMQAMIPCTICGKPIPPWQKTCSRGCAAKSLYRVDWDSIELAAELQTKTVVKIASELGCSNVAVHKRMKKLGLKK